MNAGPWATSFTVTQHRLVVSADVISGSVKGHVEEDEDGWFLSASWAQDGRTMVVLLEEPSDVSLYIAVPEKDESRKLLSAVDLGYAQWTDPEQWISCVPRMSPDGKKVAFSKYVAIDPIVDPQVDICVASTDSGRVEVVTYFPTPFAATAWSPDSSKLCVAYEDRSVEEARSRLVVVDMSGALFPLYEMAEYPDTLDWSPDGNHIVFTCCKQRPQRSAYDWPTPDSVHILSLSDGSVRQLALEAGSFFFPTWSRDGRWLGVLSALGRQGWALDVLEVSV